MSTTILFYKICLQPKKSTYDLHENLINADKRATANNGPDKL